MDKNKPFTVLLVLFFSPSGLPLLLTHGQLLPIVDYQGSNIADEIQTYIVHVLKPEGVKLLRDVDRENWHKSFLPNTTLDSGKPRLVYSYRRAISGFAAKLTAEEAEAMSSIDGFLVAHPEERLQLLTTHTPDFLGLSRRDGIWYNSCLGKGIIIGVLDTGIASTHPSFAENGMLPPPREWRGSCDFRSGAALCTNKVIGAMAFEDGRPMPVDADDDDDGHGTHAASIAAGSFVDDATVLGNANGTSAGMGPKAHLAIYKVCSRDGCDDSSILAGIDQAIDDGVDVLSVSFGGSHARPFYQDSVAIGSFQAMRHRIPTIAAAGNDGPYEGKVVNDAPWILTVGASSTDRRITATVKLGNGTELDGQSAYQPSSFDPTVMLPIMFPGYRDQGGSRGCRNDSFDGIDIEGKIVLCETGYGISNIEKGELVKGAGGAAMIVLNQQEQGFTTSSEPHVLPTAHVSFSDALTIKSYFISSLRDSMSSTATIVFRGTRLGAGPSPAVASFSSRGPSLVNGGVLKPDILGPGVNILGAWPKKVGPSTEAVASSASTFNILSGTSMAAPHLSGIVALLKNTHPRWSPAEIKSAIMTTADRLHRDGKPITDEYDGGTASLFATGAGHVNASKANDPGLVYDLHFHRYIRYLCGLGYSDEQITAVTQHRFRCSKHQDSSAEDLNMPTVLASLGPVARKTIRRRVKNVGLDSAVYFAEIEEPEGVKVEVSPYRLEFSRLYERRHFYVILTTNNTAIRKGQVSGQLSWVSNNHVVRGPISVTIS